MRLPASFVFVGIGCCFLGLAAIAILPAPLRPTASPAHDSQIKDRSLSLAHPAINLRGYSALVLLNEPLIQREVGVSTEQAQQLRVLAVEFLAHVKSFVLQRRALTDLDRANQGVRSAEIEGERKAVAARLDAAALDTLEPRQRKRLAEVALQMRIEEAFYQEDVVRELNLSIEQRRKVNSLRMRLRARAEDLLKRVGQRVISRDAAHDGIQGIRRETLQHCESLLTTEQTAIYRRLRGESVQFSNAELRLELRTIPIPQSTVSLTTGG